jgi:hypothetical protein
LLQHGQRRLPSHLREWLDFVEARKPFRESATYSQEGTSQRGLLSLSQRPFRRGAVHHLVDISWSRDNLWSPPNGGIQA